MSLFIIVTKAYFSAVSLMYFNEHFVASVKWVAQHHAT